MALNPRDPATMRSIPRSSEYARIWENVPGRTWNHNHRTAYFFLRSSVDISETQNAEIGFGTCIEILFQENKIIIFG